MVERHQPAGQTVIRVLHSDLPRGMGAMATRDERAVTVRLSRGLDPRSQRLTLSVALKAARRAGWMRRGVPAIVVFPFAVAVAWNALRGVVRKLTGGHAVLAAAGAATAAVVAAAAILLAPGTHVRTEPNAAPTAAPSVTAHPRRHRQQHARKRPRRSPVAYQLPLAQPGTVSSPSPEPVRTASRRPVPQPSPATTAPAPTPSPSSSSPQPSPSPPGRGGKFCIIVLGIVVCL